MEDIQLGPEGEFEKKRLDRLINLQQADRGFFLLASHSYIESWLRQKLHLWESSYSFDDLIFRFKIGLIENAGGFPKELGVLQALRVKEKTAEAVRKNFVDISREEAGAAAYRLIQFCRLAGIDSERELSVLSSGFEQWKDRVSRPDETADYSRKLAEYLKENRNIPDEIMQLNKYRADAELNIKRIRELEEQILKLKKDGAGHEKLQDIKKEAEQNVVESRKAAAQLEATGAYIDNIGRLTSYTRTRLDFERDITVLTPEQQTALDCINFKDDFLIKGGAGTGKTLVLLKALEKAIRRDADELDFDDTGLNVRMLTFNRTLAKYDRYIAELLEQDDDVSRISTIDKFLYDKLRRIDPDYRIVFDDGYAETLVSEATSNKNPGAGALANEIEGYIFANGITENEYLRGSGPSGSRFTPDMRIEVWTILEKIISKMLETKALTKNYSRVMILEHLIKNPDDVLLRDSDFIFIDEVQDLSAVDIRAVKACTRRAVIMAGDSDQSIYQSGFSFMKAGIDIRGNTKILKKNFRNSIEIQSLAEKYRLRSKGADPDSRPEAFRTGPPPELHYGRDEDELIGKLLGKTDFFLNSLHYDPENICILVPGSKEVEMLGDRLMKAGLNCSDLRNDDFSFSERNIIRLSTMHSSKGLDFPVVLLMLNRLPQTSIAEGPKREKMLRNLIYVTMTRAMDHLNIFSLKNGTSAEIADLIDCFS